MIHHAAMFHKSRIERVHSTTIFCSQEDMPIVYVNHVFEKATGYSASEVSSPHDLQQGQ